MRPRRTAAGLFAVAVSVPLLTVPATTAAHADEHVQQPVFENGMAQPVYSTDPDDWIVQELWVTSEVDSDDDGELDKVHFDVTRPAETEHGLDVPVVYEASPYYAGGNPLVFHDVDHELYAPTRRGQGWPGANGWGKQDRVRRDVGPSVISSRYTSTWVPRGFAVVHAESLGSGESEGCPTSGGANETAGAKAVIDWLNGRATAIDAEGNEVSADWTTGQVGMLGTSYNGTLPNAVATTGVEGLEAIVPVSAISRWYDYYRAGGAVVAPGGFQGEDTDVLAEYVYTRDNREICRPVIEQLEEDQDRLTGDYNDFWAERDYLRDADQVEAATLVAHGLQDENVKTRQAAQWYDALKANGVPHKIYWHQGGHGGMPPADVLNRWFTRYLYDVDNGVEDRPRAIVEREDGTLVEYAEWPVPQSDRVTVSVRARGDAATGELTLQRHRGRPIQDSFTDIATQNVEELAAAPDSEHGLVYTTPELSEPVHLSGVPKARVWFELGQPAANLTLGLVDLAPDGTVTRVITRGWRAPQNRHSISNTHPIRPGTLHRMHVTMQAADYVFAEGHRVGLVVMQTDHDFTIRPPAGNVFSFDTRSTLRLPVVGGRSALADAIG